MSPQSMNTSINAIQTGTDAMISINAVLVIGFLILLVVSALIWMLVSWIIRLESRIDSLTTTLYQDGVIEPPLFSTGKVNKRDIIETQYSLFFGNQEELFNGR